MKKNVIFIEILERFSKGDHFICIYVLYMRRLRRGMYCISLILFLSCVSVMSRFRVDNWDRVWKCFAIPYSRLYFRWILWNFSKVCFSRHSWRDFVFADIGDLYPISKWFCGLFISFCELISSCYFRVLFLFNF